MVAFTIQAESENFLLDGTDLIAINHSFHWIHPGFGFFPNETVSKQTEIELLMYCEKQVKINPLRLTKRRHHHLRSFEQGNVFVAQPHQGYRVRLSGKTMHLSQQVT